MTKKELKEAQQMIEATMNAADFTSDWLCDKAGALEAQGIEWIEGEGQQGILSLADKCNEFAATLAGFLANFPKLD